MTENVKNLPSVDQVLQLPATVVLLQRYRRQYLVQEVRSIVDGLRAELLAGGAAATREELLARLESELVARVEGSQAASLHRVINATGVILHTGLGRAPLSAAALQALTAAAENYCNLEFDLGTGERGSRVTHVEERICAAAHAEAAAVVNNNAAAVLLVLNTLAREREVIVSRGELVEIGGSFRIPDIIGASGARICEVGTTNRTHLRDYADAVGAHTAVILVAHPSNYRVQGFTAEVELADLVALSRRVEVPLVYDLGGGVLDDLRHWELPHEPVVRQQLELGADLVTFSGDKVLGGPQSGIIAGRRQYVEPVRSNPLMRALRCDKLILAALEATLRLFDLAPEVLRQVHPVLRMMTEAVEVVEQRAVRLVRALPQIMQEELAVQVEVSVAEFGSGALPLEELPSRAVVLQPRSCSVEDFSRRLRLGSAAVVGRIHRERLWLDMRTVRDDEVDAVVAALVGAAEEAR